jgi:hypothetical protein
MAELTGAHRVCLRWRWFLRLCCSSEHRRGYVRASTECTPRRPRPLTECQCPSRSLWRGSAPTRTSAPSLSGPSQVLLTKASRDDLPLKLKLGTLSLSSAEYYLVRGLTRSNFWPFAKVPDSQSKPLSVSQNWGFSDLEGLHSLRAPLGQKA